MPNTIFSCQTTLKKAKFLEFGLKNANLATLVGDRIMFQSHYKEGWQKGRIVRKLGTRTYIIRSSQGVLHKRNLVHIRPNRTSTCDVVFNPPCTSTCDVTPSPPFHTSVVASQSAPLAVKDTVAPARPPRIRRPPEPLRDYVCY